jgi:hypothetical protein
VRFFALANELLVVSVVDGTPSIRTVSKCGECDDSDPCTLDECDEDLLECTHPSAPAGTPCDDDTFCNGADSCDAGGGCTEHVGDPCSGGQECANLCDEAHASCFVESGVPCADDGMFCTGTELCDGDGNCVGTGDPCPGPDNDADCYESCNEEIDGCSAPDAEESPCDDGLFCNGFDQCFNGECATHYGDPCTLGGECEQTCVEDGDLCRTPAGTPCTDDEDPCTDDVCNGFGSCAHPYNDAPCDDDDGCTSNDHCSEGVCTGASSCGNGSHEEICGEACDTGGDTTVCDDDCTFPACGDEHVNGAIGEECDDGNLSSNDGCSSECLREAVCGDHDGNGFVSALDALMVLKYAVGQDVALMCPAR